MVSGANTARRLARPLLQREKAGEQPRARVCEKKAKHAQLGLGCRACRCRCR